MTDFQRYDDGYAFNVKFYGGKWPDGGTDAQRDEAYYRTRDAWWTEAEVQCQKHGFDGCYADGRTGGRLRLIPDPPRPDYDETLDADTQQRMEALAVDLTAMMQPEPIYRRFAAELQNIIDADIEETDIEETEAKASIAEAKASIAEAEAALLQLARDVVLHPHLRCSAFADKAREVLLILDPEFSP